MKKTKTDYEKRQIPHTYAIIFYIILFCAALTWIIPGGQYKESINAAGEKRLSTKR